MSVGVLGEPKRNWGSRKEANKQELLTLGCSDTSDEIHNLQRILRPPPPLSHSFLCLVSSAQEMKKMFLAANARGIYGESLVRAMDGEAIRRWSGLNDGRRWRRQLSSSLVNWHGLRSLNWGHGRRGLRKGTPSSLTAPFRSSSDEKIDEEDKEIRKDRQMQLMTMTPVLNLLC